jgi:cytoskeletal protein CcmA (bactofilin family)
MADHRDHTTIIGPDTHIKGEMVFESSACILGQFEGRITSKGTLEIGESSTCKASVDAARVIVEGTVEGDIIARDRLDLNAGAAVHGDITANKLVVAEGATFIGHCRVGEAAAKAEPTVKTMKPEGVLGFDRPRTARPAAAGVTPPANEIEATIAGFEAKLAEFSRSKNAPAAG